MKKLFLTLISCFVLFALGCQENSITESLTSEVAEKDSFQEFRELLRLIPGIDLHFVHLVRDCRAVAYSRMKKKKRPEIHWKDEYTAVITDNLDMIMLDAATRLLITMEMIKERKLPKYDLAMTAWARVDPIVDRVVKKVVQMRHDFTRTIFKELGFIGDELEMRTRLFHCYHAWEEVMFTDDNEGVNVRLQKLRYEMFLK